MDKKHEKSRYFDYSLLVIMLFLICFGLVMIYSTSYYIGMKMTPPQPAFYLNKQIKATILGFVVLVFCTFFDYRYYYKFSWIIFFVSLVAIVLVKSPIGMTLNGATRWIKIAGVSFQPAELAKLAVIITMSSYMVFVGTKIGNWKNFFVCGLILGVPGLMILILTKNLSSAIIVMGIGAVMYFVASKHYWQYALLAAVLAIGVFAVIYYISHVLEPMYENGVPDDFNYRLKRLLAWRQPEKYSDKESYQTLQSLYALGSGGIFGKGLGQSLQKLGFIPEAQNDMIFSVVCEELGLFGGICLIILFALLVWRCMVIALNAPDLMGAMLATGVAAHIAIQVVLNVAVVTNLMPNTGISLPFISYGGTSVMFLMAEMGIVLNVSRHIKYRN